jgi:hypothetical protein
VRENPRQQRIFRFLSAGIAAAVLGAWAAGDLPGRTGGQEAGADPRLAPLLEKAKAYCGRLETAALDFTCLEKIEERTYQVNELQADTVLADPVAAGKAHYSYATPRQNYYAHKYVHDYQFVRKADKNVEKRTLIEEDGRKMEVENAELTTTTIRVQNALFGPVGLLGEPAQAGHDYRIVGEETRKGRKVLIVEAAPKPGLDRQHCYGRLWLYEDDGSVLKIAWDQTSVGNFGLIQARAKQLGAEPQLTAVTEYGLEKNGLRFPSEDTTEEGYLKGDKKYVKSLTTIQYKSYKFFTVETEVRYEEACS